MGGGGRGAGKEVEIGLHGGGSRQERLWNPAPRPSILVQEDTYYTLRDALENLDSEIEIDGSPQIPGSLNQY